MDAVVSLISLFDASSIYENVEDIALWVITRVTPVLVIIAMWIRLMETQLDSFSGQSKYAGAVRDFLMFGFFMAVYFALGSLVSHAFNTFYGMFSEKGSFEVVFAQMQHFMDSINAMDKKSEGLLGGVMDQGMAILSLPVLGATALIHYISLVLVVFVLVFMRQALAIGYGLAFVWGLIAIPLAITSKFKLLRGWGVFSGAILLWPIMEALLVWFFSPVFFAATEQLISGDAGLFVAEKSGVYLLYTVLNLLICGLLVAAPLLAAALAANNSAMSSLVMPFAGGALAATAATIRATQSRFVGGVKGLGLGMGMGGRGAVAHAVDNRRAARPPSAGALGGVARVHSAAASSSSGGAASASTGAAGQAAPARGKAAETAAVVAAGKQVAGTAQAADSHAREKSERAAPAKPGGEGNKPRRKRQRSVEAARRAHFIKQSIDKGKGQ